MVTVIIPLVIVIALGFILELRRSLDERTLSGVSIYLLLPSLIFTSLLTTRMTLGGVLPLIAVALLTLGALWVLGKAVARLRRYPRDEESLFLLTAIFMNAGNMGMPVALYAFGGAGLDLAVIWVLVLNVLMNTVAVYYASRHRTPGARALRTVLGLPSIYAAAAALVMRALGLALPRFLLAPLEMLGRAIIPIAQLMLGAQLAKSRHELRGQLAGAVLPNVMRLVVSPAVAFGFVILLGVHGLSAQVAILLAAMPTAANVVVYTTEFGLQPRRAAGVVAISTVASFVTLSVILLLVG
ncbi:MAG TPA: AEC family transporter [Armatimonadota bacterium]|nr:AEC family transporter [Armatimonadota bacterium]